MKRDEAKQLAQDALRELQAALEAGRSETLQQYLNVMSRFHRYSWNNCLMIAVQRPDATHVAGFRKWRELGRQVRQGEKGIGILAPLAYRRRNDSDDVDDEDSTGLRGFKVVHVFDISQTDGQELPELAPITGDTGDLMERLEALIRAEGIKLKTEQLPFGVQGVSRKGEIGISETLDPTEHFAVLVHEWAHERMHNLDRSNETTRTIRETEAEAVAYVVCHALGFDCSTRSSDYIQLYQGTAATLTNSLHVIQTTASAMIEAIRAQTKPLLASQPANNLLLQQA